MAQFKTPSKIVRFLDNNLEVSSKLSSVFPPERVVSILSILNGGEQRILNECWDQLQNDLSRYDPATISLKVFMYHFHNYAS